MTKEEALKKYFGYDSFREGQELLVDSVLQGRAVQKCSMDTCLFQ